METTVQSVFYVIGTNVFEMPAIKADNSIREEVELKRQFKKAEENIREWQKTSVVPVNGFIVMSDVVYVVYAANTLTKKITGDVAKAVKRLIKKAHRE